MIETPGEADDGFEHVWTELAKIAESGVWDWMTTKGHIAVDIQSLVSSAP